MERINDGWRVRSTTLLARLLQPANTFLLSKWWRCRSDAGVVLCKLGVERLYTEALVRRDSSEAPWKPSHYSSLCLIYIYISYICVFSAESTHEWSYSLSIKALNWDLYRCQPKKPFMLLQDAESLSTWVTNLLAAVAAARIPYSLERWHAPLKFLHGKRQESWWKVFERLVLEGQSLHHLLAGNASVSFTAWPISTWCSTPVDTSGYDEADSTALPCHFIGCPSIVWYSLASDPRSFGFVVCN